MNLNIVYEDNNTIVINKPAGILVHPDKGQESGTLMHLILEKYPEIKKVGEPDRPGIVHRLDKGTSGLIIFARNQKSYKYLFELFKNRKITKKYLALVYGHVKEETGIITYSLKRSSKKQLKISIGPGKEAVTRYKVLDFFNYKNKDYTLLEVKPETGRTHQIRVHLHKIGHPIVGDPLYKFKNLKPPFPIDRQFLHAFSLKFVNINGKELKIEIPLPDDLQEFISKLKSDI